MFLPYLPPGGAPLFFSRDWFIPFSGIWWQIPNNLYILSRIIILIIYGEVTDVKNTFCINPFHPISFLFLLIFLFPPVVHHPFESSDKPPGSRDFWSNAALLALWCFPTWRAIQSQAYPGATGAGGRSGRWFQVSASSWLGSLQSWPLSAFVYSMKCRH